jgi:hypothetical protein
MVEHIDPTQIAGSPSDPAPNGYAKTAAGLITPEGTQDFEREDWPFAKVELLQRVARFVNGAGVGLDLKCEDERCAHDPYLRKVAINGGDGAFVLACHHKLRVCVDVKTKRVLNRRARKAIERGRARRRQRR